MGRRLSRSIGLSTARRLNKLRFFLFSMAGSHIVSVTWACEQAEKMATGSVASNVAKRREAEDATRRGALHDSHGDMHLHPVSWSQLYLVFSTRGCDWFLVQPGRLSSAKPELGQLGNWKTRRLRIFLESCWHLGRTWVSDRVSHHDRSLYISLYSTYLVDLLPKRTAVVVGLEL